MCCFEFELGAHLNQPVRWSEKSRGEGKKGVDYGIPTSRGIEKLTLAEVSCLKRAAARRVLKEVYESTDIYLVNTALSRFLCALESDKATLVLSFPPPRPTAAWNVSRFNLSVALRQCQQVASRATAAPAGRVEGHQGRTQIESELRRYRYSPLPWLIFLQSWLMEIVG